MFEKVFYCQGEHWQADVALGLIFIADPSKNTGNCPLPKSPNRNPLPGYPEMDNISYPYFSDPNQIIWYCDSRVPTFFCDACVKRLGAGEKRIPHYIMDNYLHFTDEVDYSPYTWGPLPEEYK